MAEEVEVAGEVQERQERTGMNTALETEKRGRGRACLLCSMQEAWYRGEREEAEKEQAGRQPESRAGKARSESQEVLLVV